MKRMYYRQIGVAIALIVGLAVVLWFSAIPRRPALDPPAIVAQIQQLNQLATVKYTIQKVIGITEDKLPVGSESILLIMQATVHAGIDLSKLQERDVTFRIDGTVELRLPPAQVLTVAVDEKETKVWDRQKTWWTPWVPYSKDLEQRARVSGLETVKQAALDMQILKQAERNAETSIRTLLNLAGAKSVVVIPAGIS